MGRRHREIPLEVNEPVDTLVERARAAGGYVDITSTPGEGTRISIAVPSAAEPS